MENRSEFNLYRDIAERTDGDVYVGVVGPVRTGKSTFITRFMEQLVLPELPESARRDRIRDELPQSGSGRSIMTSQPHFVPNEAVRVSLTGDIPVSIRLVDSVGYMVEGALGAEEEAGERMVHTPWFDQDVPFERAAEIGTRRVMTDHATIGLVVTTDGSITDIPRSSYAPAEERVVRELKALGKPFVMVLNSAAPRSAAALSLRDSLEDLYGVPVMLLNVREMQVEDIQRVLESVLLEFPLREVRVQSPGWLDALDEDHWLVQHVLEGIRSAGSQRHVMRETDLLDEAFSQSPYVQRMDQVKSDPGTGSMTFTMSLKDGLFNQVLSEECGTEIEGDAHLLKMMKELVHARREYEHVAEALAAVRSTGYGIVTPGRDELTLEEPQLVRQGSQFGVKLKAHAPSLHLIRVDIETEVTPVVGTEEQSADLVQKMTEEFTTDPAKVWETSFFGRSLESMVREGLNNKLMRMPADAQEKVQETLTRIVNEGEGGMICILL